MKKTLIALAAVAVSSAAMAQATVYGIVDLGYDWSKTKDAAGATTADTAGPKSGVVGASRLGFRASEDLEGGMKAGIHLEGGFLAATSADKLDFDRVAVLNLSGAFGNISYGFNAQPSFSMLVGYDVTGQAANTTTNLNPNGTRDTGVFYSNKFGPVAVNAFVTTGKSGKPTAENKKNATDITVTYAAGPLSVGAAFGNSKVETAAIAKVAGVDADGKAGSEAVAATDKKVAANAVGASYDLGMAKVFVSMSNQKNTNNLTSKTDKKAETNVGVSVPMGKITLMAGYGMDKDTTDAGVTKKSNDTVLGLNYAMSKRTVAYAYMSTNEDPAASGAKNAKTTSTAIGLRHSF